MGKVLQFKRKLSEDEARKLWKRNTFLERYGTPAESLHSLLHPTDWEKTFSQLFLGFDLEYAIRTMEEESLND